MQVSTFENTTMDTTNYYINYLEQRLEMLKARLIVVQQTLYYLRNKQRGEG